MKKLLAGVVVGLPIILAGATWGISNKTESVFDEMILQSNEKLSSQLPFMKVEKETFKKGFTSSSAKSVVSLDADIFGETDEPLRVVMNHKIYHGPLMMTENGLKTGSSYTVSTIDQASLEPKVKKLIEQFFAGKQPIVSGVQTSLTGDLVVDIEMAPFDIDLSKVEGADLGSAEVFKFGWDGVSGNFKTNAEGSFIKGTMDAGEMTLIGKEEGEDITFSMSPSTTFMDVNELYLGSILDGVTKVVIPELSFGEGKSGGVTLKNMTIDALSSDKDNQFSGEVSIEVEQVSLKDLAGPVNFPDSKFILGAEVKGFETAAFKKLLDVGQEMQALQFKTIGGHLSGEPDEMFLQEIEAVSQRYMQAFGEMIKEGVQINYDLALSNETGRSAVDLDLLYSDSKKMFELKTLKELILALSGKLTISVGKGMLEGTPLEDAMGMPVAMGFAVDKGESFEANADLALGVLNVNGEPMPVLEMLGSMIDQPIPWDAVLEGKEL